MRSEWAVVVIGWCKEVFFERFIYNCFIDVEWCTGDIGEILVTGGDVIMCVVVFK